ncbi:MAG: SLC5 family protein, partial [Pseudomonadota bacterium]
LILTLALLVVWLSLNAIDFDFSGIPADRLTLIGANSSPIPWHTLLTGMIFIQTFYWSTNQVITQRAMAAPDIKEAQKGVLTAAAIRLLIVPVIVVVPGIVAFKLYGDIGDAAYGRIVGDILPVWLSGAFAAGIAAAVLTTFNSILNASAALYVCDIHQAFIGSIKNIPRTSGIVSIVMTALSIALVPIFASQDSLINTVQEAYGLLSMPILSAFIVGLAFRNVHAFAAIIGVLAGVLFYAVFTYVWEPFHFIHGMFLTLIVSIGLALLSNVVFFGRRIEPAWRTADPAVTA